MKITGFDHIVLNVADVAATLRFYESVLGMKPREESPGKWALHFGAAKISLQQPDTIPDMAKRTAPGTANFCVVTQDDIAKVAEHLHGQGVEIIAGPGPKIGALGAMKSVYFYDPDGNLVEVCSYG